MEAIKDIHALQVLDSRGNPTIKVVVKTEHFSGSAIVPSGASTGSHEAIELRDNKKPYQGKGVEKAVDIINRQIAKRLAGMDVKDQAKIDSELNAMDGTPNKSRIGGNTIIGVSLAVCRAAAASENKELYDYIATLVGNRDRLCLPVPLANIINGGKHAGNFLKVQEFMIIPKRASSFSDATRIISECYHTLKKIIEEKYGASATNVGDEGGFAPPIRSADEALKIILDAVHKAGYRRYVYIGMDVAASNLFSQNTYDVGANFASKELIAYYDQLYSRYGVKSFEDPFAEDDFDSWQEFMKGVARKRKLQVVGDDLTVTNEARVRLSEDKKLCNAIILKTNQVGTLTEALAAASLAKSFGWEIIVSHRSGESEDSFIADLAVGIGANQIKLGAPCRGERTTKYNRLLEIEDSLKKPLYAGKNLRY